MKPWRDSLNHRHQGQKQSLRGSRSGGDRLQREMKSGALTELGFNPNVAMVLGHNFAARSKANP